MRRTVCRLTSFALLLNALSLASPFAFSAYTFINVADTNTPAPSGNFTGFRPGPAIGSDVGAFLGFYSGGSGIFTGYGGSITTIAKTGDTAGFSSFGTPAKLGAVAFFGRYMGRSGIFLGDGGSLTTIAKTGDPAPSDTFTSFGNVAMYDSASVGSLDPNTVAFLGFYDTASIFRSGIFIGSGGTLTTIVKTGDAAPSGTFGGFGRPDLTGVYADCCTRVPSVAFHGSYGLRGQGVFTKSNGVLTTIATTDTLPAANFGDPVALGNLVAFRINVEQPIPTSIPPQAIWSNYSGGLERIVAQGDQAPAGTFTRFGDPAITYQGIAFEGTYAAGASKGIFTRFAYAGSGYLGPIESIIKTGDSLFGSQVNTVGMMHFGGSPEGDFAFSYTLSDGRQGIALAIAVPESTTNSTILLALLGTSFLRDRRGHRSTCPST